MLANIMTGYYQENLTGLSGLVVDRKIVSRSRSFIICEGKLNEITVIEVNQRNSTGEASILYTKSQYLTMNCYT